LPGMHERAKLVGGKLAVWSKLHSGTEIELSIPASSAYASSRIRRGPWFSRKERRQSRERLFRLNSSHFGCQQQDLGRSICSEGSALQVVRCPGGTKRKDSSCGSR
jgi:hypothetical protein